MIIKSTNKLKLTLLAVLMSGAGSVALACLNEHEGPKCAATHGACTLIDDTEVTFIEDTAAATGYKTRNPSTTDECGYQCGSEYEGVGHQFIYSGTCPA